MILTSSENLKDTWSTIFRRKGGNGTYTRLFDSLDPQQKSTLLSSLTLQTGEFPVIGSIRDVNNWLILTTERLIWCVEGKREELVAEIIRDATADFTQLQRTGRSKLDMCNLQITTIAGKEYSIELEPGQPLSGTWDVLKNLAARNRSTDRHWKQSCGGR